MASPPPSTPVPVDLIYGTNPKGAPTINTRGVLIDGQGNGVDYDIYGAEINGSGDGSGGTGTVGGNTTEITDYCYNIIEIPDGIITIFTLRFNYLLGSCKVYLNGLRQTLDDGSSNYDYIELGAKQIQFFTPPRINTRITVDYVGIDTHIFESQFENIFE